MHFALICAAAGCPPLRREAYTPNRLEQQLQDQAEYIHSHKKWYRFETNKEELQLTHLYDWYRGDFQQVAGSVPQYAAQYDPELKKALTAGKTPEIKWLKFDWSLNSQP